MNRAFADKNRQRQEAGIAAHKCPASPRLRHGGPASAGHRHRGRLAASLLTIILAGIPFLLGKYFEFNSPGPFDSGAYVYSAKHILDGARLGVDEQPSANVGTLLVNMLGVRLFGFGETGPKLIQAIMQTAALAVMFAAMRRVFGLAAAVTAVTVSSIYLSAPLIAKFGNVKEQYMIASMVLGVSCLLLYQANGRWWCAVLCGAFLAWAPLFKPTGISGICAAALFIIAQPILKHRPWRQTCIDIGLLLAGALLGVAPICIWLAAVKGPLDYWPYAFALEIIIPGGAAHAGYIAGSRRLQTFAQQCPRVLRYYSLLALPILLAFGAIVIRIRRMFCGREGKISEQQDRFVLLLAAWWLLDMAFVWISPRSYEEYYLPLNASGAMLGGYLIAVFADKLKDGANRARWLTIASAGILCMVGLSWHIFSGIDNSPHSGAAYRQKQRGYLQSCRQIEARRRYNFRGYWEIIGEYIRDNSTPQDQIYVWGWYPGIYVIAQRFSPAAQAFTSEMHVMSPEALSGLVAELLSDFRREMPKFIVDSRKQHFPWDRPALELWPRTQAGFLPADRKTVQAYDSSYSKMLAERFGQDEARRYGAMQPFREFVMNNYEIVGSFGEHILFRLRTPAGG